MVFDRQDKIAKLLKKGKNYYDDFTLSFDVHPTTGDLIKITNEDSLKQSLTQLFNTNLTERLYQPMFGTKIKSLLFEVLDEKTSNDIKLVLETAIKNCEQRISNFEIFVTANYDKNGYDVKIVFVPNNIPQETELEIFLNRKR